MGQVLATEVKISIPSIPIWLLSAMGAALLIIGSAVVLYFVMRRPR